jgi:hypothetical protein
MHAGTPEQDHKDSKSGIMQGGDSEQDDDDSMPAGLEEL